MAFNDEALARAIHASTIPVVSAVGHEIDFTIADFVADLRAPTPSAAAELLVPDAGDLARGIARQRDRLAQHARRALESRMQRIDHLQARLGAQRPQARLARAGERLDALRRRLADCARHGLERRAARATQVRVRLGAQHPLPRLLQRSDRACNLGERLRGAALHGLDLRRRHLGELARTLHAVSPLATLERGYAIVRRRDSGVIVRAAGQVAPGDALRIRLADGELGVLVEAT
jgi:exodeoxyribonuclease VII large subunit